MGMYLISHNVGSDTMSEIKTIKRKIVLLGDGAVGKTSLIRRFVSNKYDDKYLCTVGTKVTEKDLLMKFENQAQLNLKLMIWDFMGQKGFKKVERSGLKGTTGAIIVYDVSRRETFASIEKYWLPVLFETAPDVPIIFLANKIDLLSGIEKDTPEAKTMVEFQEMVNRYNASGYFTSALSGENVESAFSGLGKILVKNLPKKPTFQLPEKVMRHVNGFYESAIIKATDEIIMDFYKNYGSTLEETMPIIRKQFKKAGVDINQPTIEGLRKAIDLLGKVESNFWSRKVVSCRRKKRLSIINQLAKELQLTATTTAKNLSI
jgi:small GTP-binding protein